MSDYPFEWCKHHDERSLTCKDCELEHLNTTIATQQATITNLLKENARLKVEIADLEQDGEPYPYM